MATANHRDRVKAILDAEGRTFADEIGIRLKDTPAPLFQLLNASLLMSARISTENAVRAARALIAAKLTTPQKVAEATWQQRVDVLTSNGYKRYDERTSTMLGETAEMLIESYGGDLRNLREEASRDAGKEHQLLQQFKGIGKTGADIFLREVQLVWSEALPYADDRVLASAKKVGLPPNAHGLARLVDKDDFPRLVAGLIRIDLTGSHKELEQLAQ